jgi:thioredoxin 1
MRVWQSISLLVIPLCACSSPEARPGVDPAAIPASAAPATKEAARTVSPPGEIDVPDAGTEPPQLASLAPGLPMLLDFTREDCLPCKLMEPWLAALRERHAGRIAILALDLDQPDSRDLVRFFKARSVPMQVYVDAHGREVSRNVGLATLPQMQNQLEKLGFLGSISP